jgi:hypothetical protein
MALKYPTIRIRMAFSRAQAVLYEDYLAVESLHSFGMVSEDSRAYYEEIRWVMKYEKRDWFRAGHIVLACFPMLVGVLFLVLAEAWIASLIGMVLVVPCAMWIVYSLYRLIAVPRTEATLVSSRGTVKIGVDWPKSANRLKDASAFFETLLGKLKLVAAMPAPPAPPVPPPLADAAPPLPGVPAPAAETTPPGPAPPG